MHLLVTVPSGSRKEERTWVTRLSRKTQSHNLIFRVPLAFERPQIAWVRTALALISFGFAIANVFQYLRQQKGETATLMSPRMVGLVMVVIGLVGLILANLQQRRAVLAFSSSTLIV
jgi:putative membrane protein